MKSHLFRKTPHHRWLIGEDCSVFYQEGDKDFLIGNAYTEGYVEIKNLDRLIEILQELKEVLSSGNSVLE